MRIITGKLKGRRIHIPNKLDLRPTTDRTKESMFAAIEARKNLQGTNILDLYAGSGNLGFEAISRGADQVVFVETNTDAVRHIRKTAVQFNVNDQITALHFPVEKFIHGPSQAFDLIFADPPYDTPFISELITIILENNWLKENGWFIIEHDKRHNFTDHPHCGFSKAFGRTIVSIFYEKPVSPDEN